MPAPLDVFLDCEFSSMDRPALLSMGMVTSSGKELYVELSGPALHSALAGASDFVLSTVLPQFGTHPAAKATSNAELGHMVAAWLQELRSVPLSVCYDYHSDMDLLEESLRAAGIWDELRHVLEATHVAYLLGEPSVREAMERSWNASSHEDRIGRHHALADARALRAGFEAMHHSGR